MRHAYAGNHGSEFHAGYGDAWPNASVSGVQNDYDRVSGLKQALDSIEQRLASAAAQASLPQSPFYPSIHPGMVPVGQGQQNMGMLQAQINQLAAQISRPSTHFQPQPGRVGDPALAAEEIAQRQQMLNAGTQTGPMPRRPQPGTGYQSGANVMADQLDELKQELAKISKQVAKPVADQSSVPQKEIERIARAISELKSQSEPSIEYFDRLTEELSNLRNFMKNDVQSAIRKGMQSKAGAQAQDLAKRIDALSADMKATIRTEVQGKDGAVMTELNQRLGTLNQVVDELSVQSANTLNPRVEGLVDQVDALRMTVDDLPQTLAISRIEERLAELGTKIEGFHSGTHSAGISSEEQASVEARLDEIARALVAVSNNQNQAPIVDMSAVDRVEARMSELARTLDTIMDEGNGSDLDRLTVRIEGLTERLGSFEKYAEAGDLGAASALFASPETGMIEAQLRSLNARLDEAAAPADTSLLEDQLRKLSFQVEEASNAHSTSAQISNLEAQIGLILRQMSEGDGSNEIDLSPMEARLGQIENQLAQNQNFSLEAAQQAAQHAVSMMGPQNDLGQVIEALSHDLKSLQLIAEGGNAENQQTVHNLQQTLDQVMDRLGTIEGTLQESAKREASLVAPRQSGSTAPAQTNISAVADELESGSRNYEATFASDGLVEAAKADEKLGLAYDIGSDDEPAQPAGSPAPAPLASGPENQPLEPGSAAPAADMLLQQSMAKIEEAKAKIGHAEDKTDGQVSMEEFPSDDMRPDAVAAARRALQATTAEMSAVRKETSIKAKKRKKKSLAGLFSSSGESRLRKPLVLGAAALLLAIVSFKTIGLITGSGSVGGKGPVAKVTKPSDQVGQVKKKEQTRSPQISTSPTVQKNQLSAPKPTVRTIGKESVVATSDGPTSTFEKSGPVPSAKEMVKTMVPTPVLAQKPPAANKAVAINNRDAGPNSVAPVSAPEAAPAKPIAEPVNSVFDVPANAGPAALVAAASSGDPKALFQLGMRYSDGKGVSRNMAESAKWFLRSAETGFAPAQYSIGSLYEKGIGVERDVNSASQWYEKAAAQGNARAMHNLAVIYAMGNPPSIQPNMDKAVSWFKKAAKFGIKDSQFNLGILYGQGMGVPQNLSVSYTWFALAAKTGDADASKKRDEVANAMDPDDLADARRAVNNWAPNKLKESVNRVAVPEEWRGNARGSAASVAPQSDQLVKQAQALLNQRGFNVGEPDGLIGPKTKQAIMEFQRNAEIPITGKVDKQLLQALNI